MVEDDPVAVQPKFCRHYNRIDKEQLRSDIYAKIGTLYMIWQIQYFKAIIMGLLELHAPLRRL
jgi:hypothetical protein